MAADKSVSVRLVGLSAVTTALREVAGKAGSSALKESLGGIVGRIAGAARPKVPSSSGRAAGSIQGRATARGGSIVFGGTAAEYMPWLDFGGSVGRGHKAGPNMGAIHRDWMGVPIGSGRYVYPTISEHREETLAAVLDAVSDAARGAGFEVRG
jgi:hypothetical protein